MLNLDYKSVSKDIHYFVQSLFLDFVLEFVTLRDCLWLQLLKYSRYLSTIAMKRYSSSCGVGFFTEAGGYWQKNHKFTLNNSEEIVKKRANFSPLFTENWSLCSGRLNSTITERSENLLKSSAECGPVAALHTLGNECCPLWPTVAFLQSCFVKVSHQSETILFQETILSQMLMLVLSESHEFYCQLSSSYHLCYFSPFELQSCLPA